jgi:molybdopterin-guanine dinucleotide biosynthesis protein A
LWRLTAIRTLPDDIHNGTAPHSLKRLIAALRSARLDYSPLAPEDPFANVNTAEDLMNLRSRESSMTRG